MLFSPKVGIYFYFSNYLLKILLIYREDATIISLYPLHIDPPIVTILPHLLFLFLSVSHPHSSTQHTHTRFPFAEPSESSRYHNTWCLNTQLPGASTGDPTHDKVRQRRPDKQGCRTRGTPWADPTHDSHVERPDEQGRSGLEGPPGPARASTPKSESVCLTTLCLSPTLLILTEGYPWPPFSGKN